MMCLSQPGLELPCFLVMGPDKSWEEKLWCLCLSWDTDLEEICLMQLGWNRCWHWDLFLKFFYHRFIPAQVLTGYFLLIQGNDVFLGQKSEDMVPAEAEHLARGLDLQGSLQNSNGIKSGMWSRDAPESSPTGSGITAETLPSSGADLSASQDVDMTPLFNLSLQRFCLLAAEEMERAEKGAVSPANSLFPRSSRANTQGQGWGGVFQLGTTTVLMRIWGLAVPGSPVPRGKCPAALQAPISAVI